MHARRRPALGGLLPILCATLACVSKATLVPESAPVTASPVAWVRPASIDERARADRWRSAVGDPVVLDANKTAEASDHVLTVVAWNTDVGGGDIGRLITDLRAGRLTGGRPVRSFVALLQEVYRSDSDVPGRLRPHARSARAVRSASRHPEIVTVARALGVSLYYVPSMRNGAAGNPPEDRGNAILSTLPLSSLAAIELPLERQRRVVPVASIDVAVEPHLSLRVASVHLSNMVGHHLWLLAEAARVRQARALAEVLTRKDGPLVVGGDFNTWFGYHDAGYREVQRSIPTARPSDRRPTFGRLRLDHVFYILPPGWGAAVHRADEKYGSDHYPLIAEIRHR